MTRKLIINKPGGYDQLSVVKSKTLKPKGKELLIKVKAAGVNYADCIIRWGLYKSAKQFVGYPITPGFEFSGYVEELGDDVTKFKKGDSVVGVSLFGAQASHLIAEENRLFIIPEGISFEEAAAMPAVYITAYHALFQNVVTRPGMRVLIHSAAGGVGGALVQLSKCLGLEVIGVVGSSHKVQVVKDLGADHVIDKSKEKLWKRAEEISDIGYDLIFDANGYSTLQDGFKHLRSTGKLVAYGFHSMFPKKGGRLNPFRLIYGYLTTPRFSPMDLSSENKSIICFNLSFLFERIDLLEEAMHGLFHFLKEKKIKAPQVTSYPLEEAYRAHQDLESGKTTGKLVLIP